jgi:hypothetical protein
MPIVNTEPSSGCQVSLHKRAYIVSGSNILSSSSDGNRINGEGSPRKGLPLMCSPSPVLDAVWPLYGSEPALISSQSK